MDPLLLGAYILIWPALTLIVLVVIWTGVIKEYLEARRSGDDVV